MMRYCPNCRSEGITFDDKKRYFCKSCNWTYYQNAAAAAMAFLILNGKIIFTRRAKDPQKGWFDLPGGFIEPGETAEDGLKREIKEELGLDVLKLDYVGSAANTYFYKNIYYTTCDLIYSAKINTPPAMIDKLEISEYVFKSLDEVNLNEIAFESVKTALKLFEEKKSGGNLL